ncbi:hypothetical protein [Yoonia sp.]|uniref:hypothetical protein n=1 Tax=Yoonia sp. TaxID=2212373 RepID=UPI00358F4F98
MQRAALLGILLWGAIFFLNFCAFIWKYIEQRGNGGVADLYRANEFLSAFWHVHALNTLFVIIWMLIYLGLKKQFRIAILIFAAAWFMDIIKIPYVVLDVYARDVWAPKVSIIELAFGTLGLVGLYGFYQWLPNIAPEQQA